MTTTVTKTELNKMISQAVEQNLLELLGDPEEGLVLKKSLVTRLVRQKRRVAQGERGNSFDKVAGRLGLR